MKFIGCLFFALLLVSCASNSKNNVTLTKTDSLAIAKAVNAKAAEQDSAKDSTIKEQRLPENIDAAHESFIRAIEMDLRGEKQLANVFWQHAAESDPYNRYLAFKLAEIMQQQGADSLALLQAQRASSLSGKITAAQLGLLAHLYVKDGIADSSRKYFNAAIDSSHNQDMALLYDFSLFLEAINDKKELVRVYDLLLPHVRYMPTLFKREAALLAEQKNDSALIELYAKRSEVVEDKLFLAEYVQLLLILNKFDKAYAIADTLTLAEGDTEDLIGYESIVLFVGEKLAEKDSAASYEFFKKKFYVDNLKTPVIMGTLGLKEVEFNNIDSGKVHLLKSVKMLEALNDDRTIRLRISVYQVLGMTAFKEGNTKDAVMYAEKADSIAVSINVDYKIRLAIAYNTAKMYDKAYKLLDSLITVWDNYKPMQNIMDSSSVQKISLDVMFKRIMYRNYYVQVLSTQALSIEEKDLGDSVKIQAARPLREHIKKLHLQVCDLTIDANSIQKSELESADLAYSTVRMKVDMAMNLERMGDYDKAFDLFDSLLDVKYAKIINLPEILNYYGYTLIDLNRNQAELDSGISMVQRALDLINDSNFAYIDSKAWGLYRKGDFKSALEQMQLISDSSFFNDKTYWEHLAAIQEALGLMPDAEKSYKKLLKLQPKNRDAKRFFKAKKNKK